MHSDHPKVTGINRLCPRMVRMTLVEFPLARVAWETELGQGTAEYGRER